MSADPNQSEEWPDRLYKYMSLADDKKRNHARDIFEREMIHFSAPSDLNDPFDCQFVPELTATPEEERRFFLECLVRQHPSREEAERELQEILGPGGDEKRQRIREEIRLNGESARDRTRVFCLTKVKDDILMWSHYADCHRGICLEFGFCHGFPQHDNFLIRASPVQYQAHFPVVNPYKSLEGRTVFTKSDHWKYEKEHRLVYVYPSRQTGDHEERLPPALLEGVILGAQISEANRQLVLGWARNRTRPLKVYEARLKEREYVLDIIRLADGRTA